MNWRRAFLMAAICENLRNARNRKSLKQSEVAEKLGCAATSLTNWESGKVMPSLEVLDKLCEIYEISPLSLLDKEYGYYDIVAISEKPVGQRTYEEQVALNFSHSILNKLCSKEAIRQETERTKASAAFLKNNHILERFGQLDAKSIAAIKSDYDRYGKADADILFAFHSLTPENKRAFLSMLCGLLSGDGNTLTFAEHMDEAIVYTLEMLNEQKADLSV